ncbi:MAG: RNA polymerase sigma factor [Planctomycetota bacterium]
MISQPAPESPVFSTTAITRLASDAELIACTVSTADDHLAQMAFAHLYDRHSERVLRFLQERVRSSLAAEDLLQEVFLRVYRKLPSLASRDHFPGWLKGISRNCLLDHFRRRKRVRLLDDDVPAEDEVPGEHGLPARKILRRDLLRRVERALDQLPGSAARMIRLRYFEDWTLQEIAADFGCEPHQVKYRLRDARQRLRWLLREVWREYTS